MIRACFEPGSHGLMVTSTSLLQMWVSYGSRGRSPATAMIFEPTWLLLVHSLRLELYYTLTLHMLMLIVANDGNTSTECIFGYSTCCYTQLLCFAKNGISATTNGSVVFLPFLIAFVALCTMLLQAVALSIGCHEISVRRTIGQCSSPGISQSRYSTAQYSVSVPPKESSTLYFKESNTKYLALYASCVIVNVYHIQCTAVSFSIAVSSLHSNPSFARVYARHQPSYKVTCALARKPPDMRRWSSDGCFYGSKVAIGRRSRNSAALTLPNTRAFENMNVVFLAW